MSVAVEVRQQKSLTLILARGFASNLSMPISVHDPTGTIVFYNEPAEAAFGVTFAEMGELSAAEWTARYSPAEADGTAIPLEELPVGVALAERRPAHRTVHFTRPDNVGYVAEVTAFPLMGREEELFGAMRIFWEDAASPRGRVSGVPPGVAAAQDSAPRHGGPKGIVLLLAREFASNLATPIYLADRDGTLVYFNEPAERIGGRSFAEVGEMPLRQWVELLRPRSVDGAPLHLAEMPGGVAFDERRPAHARLRIESLNGAEREIATTAFPLSGPDEAFHGIMVIFWKQE